MRFWDNPIKFIKTWWYKNNLKNNLIKTIDNEEEKLDSRFVELKRSRINMSYSEYTKSVKDNIVTIDDDELEDKKENKKWPPEDAQNIEVEEADISISNDNPDKSLDNDAPSINDVSRERKKSI